MLVSGSVYWIRYDQIPFQGRTCDEAGIRKHRGDAAQSAEVGFDTVDVCDDTVQVIDLHQRYLKALGLGVSLSLRLLSHQAPHLNFLNRISSRCLKHASCFSGTCNSSLHTSYISPRLCPHYQHDLSIVRWKQF